MKYCASEIVIGVILGCITFAILFCFVIGIKRCVGEPIPIPAVNRIVSQETKERMRFHGIEVAYEGHDGKLFFYREGKVAL